MSTVVFRLDVSYDPSTGKTSIEILPVGARAMSNESGASFSDRVNQYLEHGRQQGGKGGRPWNAKHARMRTDHLTLWTEILKAKTLEDVTLERDVSRPCF